MRRSRSRTRVSAGAVACALVAAACAPRAAGIDARYFAVHDAFAALGLAQRGPIVRASLAAGESARSVVELSAGCSTVVALGGDGIRAIEASLLGSDGAVLGHDAGHGAQATVRACVARAGTYALEVKATSGAGDLLAATWAGGTPEGDASFAAAAETDTEARARGTCDSPLPLTVGDVAGTTVHGESANDPSCASSTSREIVYRLVLAKRQRLTVETIDPKLDTVIYIRQDDCEDPSAEVDGACNDDYERDRRSRLRLVLEPGTYYVFVDGLSADKGAYTLRTALEDVPTIADACRAPEPLTSGVEVRGDTSNTFDATGATCGDGAHGNDVPYSLEIRAPSRVRITETADDMSSVVHVRATCVDSQSEVGCSTNGVGVSDATYTGVLGPGTYAVFADSNASGGSGGAFALVAETQPARGSGGAGDSCGDAQPIPRSGAVHGDTFASRDDLSASCGGAGAADSVYRVDLARKTRLSAHVTKQEGHHVVALTKACGDPSSELACGPAVNELLPAGTYWIAVDGAKPTDFGRYELDVRLVDVGGQEAACKAAVVLHPGVTVQGSTGGAGDKFTTTCGGSDDAQSSDDRVYRVDLARRTHVSFRLSTPGHDGVLALRSVCVDGPSGARASEIECNNDAGDTRHSRIDRTLEAGSYYVVVDGHMAGNVGDYTLEYRVLK